MRFSRKLRIVQGSAMRHFPMRKYPLSTCQSLAAKIPQIMTSQFVKQGKRLTYRSRTNMGLTSACLAEHF